MFRGSVEVVGMIAAWRPGRGWTLTVTHRHSGEVTFECEAEHYEALSSAELADVIAASSGVLLEGSGHPEGWF